MRLPYAPTTPPSSDPNAAAIYDRIAARRHPRPLIPLDLTLLHSPPVADGYNAFVGALRTQTVVPPALLELAISHVAILTDAVYEWNIHAALGLKVGLKPGVLSFAKEVGKGELAKAATENVWLDEKKLAVLRYTDEVTVDVKVQNDTFERQKGLFTDRQVLEITTVVAGYNAVSRILVSLDVGENNAKSMKSVKELEDGLKA